MNIFERVLSVIAPHYCLVCDVEGKIICSTCVDGAFIPAPSRCYRCHRATEQFQVCSPCRSSTRLKHVWISTSYEGTAKTMIQAMKFRRAGSSAQEIALCMSQTVPILPKDTLVCHIPTANSRIRRRGYDQAGLIARHLSQAKGLQHTSLLCRLTSTRQVGSSREQRYKQAQEAFELSKPALVAGAHILLVDDVTTSGATLEAAAKLLRASGAKSIDAAVFAAALD